MDILAQCVCKAVENHVAIEKEVNPEEVNPEEVNQERTIENPEDKYKIDIGTQRHTKTTQE
jgi:hypothetical protein